MDKYFIWIHYERLHNHNKAKHNKTVCIFLGIYCNSGKNIHAPSEILLPSWSSGIWYGIHIFWISQILFEKDFRCLIIKSSEATPTNRLNRSPKNRVHIYAIYWTHGPYSPSHTIRILSKYILNFQNINSKTVNRIPNTEMSFVRDVTPYCQKASHFRVNVAII